jgi:hypothetical protein
LERVFEFCSVRELFCLLRALHLRDRSRGIDGRRVPNLRIWRQRWQPHHYPPSYAGTSPTIERRQEKHDKAPEPFAPFR